MSDPVASQRKEVIEKNKAALLEFMKANNIHKTVARFDGSGDSGQIEEVNLYSEKEEVLDSDLLDSPADVIMTRQIWSPETKWVLHTEVTKLTIRDLVEETAWHPLESRFGDWEINEGSYGEVIIYADGKGEIECNQRIVEIEQEYAEF
jgi:hypothetical protein